MFLKKQGYPQEGELVLCTVTKVQHTSVFARLDEFENKSGMIHISEISPGRIRNIRDYVKEGKVIVCTVLRINLERGYIDLSLRRVSDMQRRNKVNQIKQEQKAEKILEFVAKQVKKPMETVYKEIKQTLEKHEYALLYPCFEDFVIEAVTFKELEIPSIYLKILEEVVKQRIKPPEVSISGKLKLQCYEPNGVEIIKKALKKGLKAGDNIDLKYLGAGKYGLVIKAEEYKTAEKVLKNVTNAVTKEMKNYCEVEFIRDSKAKE